MNSCTGLGPVSSLNSVLVGIFFFSLAGQASTSSFIGSDLADPHWRTPSVVKPLDPDHDNIYGTAGYALLGGSLGSVVVNPTGVTVARLASGVFNGNSGYVTIDNPNGGSYLTGVWYNNPVTAGQAYNYASLTFSKSETYVVGVLVDNMDFANISPAQLRVYQTTGGSADSGYINSYLSTSRQGDWYFFTVSGNAGDVFYVSGIAEGSQTGSSGIGALSFDAVPSSVPAVSPLAMVILAAGLAVTAWFALRRLFAGTTAAC